MAQHNQTHHQQHHNRYINNNNNKQHQGRNTTTTSASYSSSTLPLSVQEVLSTSSSISATSTASTKSGNKKEASSELTTQAWVTFGNHWGLLLSLEQIKLISLVSHAVHSTFKQMLESRFILKLPPSEKLVHLHPQRLEVSSLDFIPPSVKHLTIVKINPKISDNLPDTLRSLVMLNFNRQVDHFPSSLTSLNLGPKFNFPLDNLPTCIRKLVVGNGFDQPMDNLPPQLTTITLGRNFNRPIDNLPRSVTQISIGDYFDQPIDNLPPNLTHLTFSSCSNFNQPVDKLPSSITHLKFGEYIRQHMHNLPLSLVELRFSNRYTGGPNSFEISLQRSTRLTYLSFPNHIGYVNSKLPSSITNLEFEANFNTQQLILLPPALLHLTFGECFKASSLKSIQYPSSLTNLTINNYSASPLDTLNSLTHLTLAGDFMQVTTLPPFLRHLSVTLNSSNTSFLLINVNFPPSLCQLFLLGCFNQPLGEKGEEQALVTIREASEAPKRLSYLPPSLTQLTFGANFNKAVDHLPPTLTKLTFGNDFNQTVNHLPPKLQSLTFGDSFNKLVDLLPKTLVHLRLGKKFSYATSLELLMSKCLFRMEASVLREIRVREQERLEDASADQARIKEKHDLWKKRTYKRRHR